MFYKDLWLHIMIYKLTIQKQNMCKGGIFRHFCLRREYCFCYICIL